VICINLQKLPGQPQLDWLNTFNLLDVAQLMRSLLNWFKYFFRQVTSHKSEISFHSVLIEESRQYTGSGRDIQVPCGGIHMWLKTWRIISHKQFPKLLHLSTLPIFMFNCKAVTLQKQSVIHPSADLKSFSSQIIAQNVFTCLWILTRSQIYRIARNAG